MRLHKKDFNIISNTQLAWSLPFLHYTWYIQLSLYNMGTTNFSNVPEKVKILIIHPNFNQKCSIHWCTLIRLKVKLKISFRIFLIALDLNWMQNAYLYSAHWCCVSTSMEGVLTKFWGTGSNREKKNKIQFTKLPSSVGWGVGLFLLLFSHFSLSPSIFSFPFTRFFRCVLNLSMVRGARVPVPCIVFPYTWLPWKKSRRDRHSWIRQDTGTFCSSTPFVSTSAQREVLK